MLDSSPPTTTSPQQLPCPSDAVVVISVHKPADLVVNRSEDFSLHGGASAPVDMNLNMYGGTNPSRVVNVKASHGGAVPPVNMDAMKFALHGGVDDVADHTSSGDVFFEDGAITLEDVDVSFGGLDGFSQPPYYSSNSIQQ